MRQSQLANHALESTLPGGDIVTPRGAAQRCRSDGSRNADVETNNRRGRCGRA